MPDRRVRFKGADVADARNHARFLTLDAGHPDTISVETGELTAADVAEQIVNKLKT
jgi:hypothetical protein